MTRKQPLETPSFIYGFCMKERQTKAGKLNLGCVFMIADVFESFYCFKATFAPNSFNQKKPQYFSVKVSCRKCTVCVCLCGVEAGEAVRRTKTQQYHNTFTTHVLWFCCGIVVLHTYLYTFIGGAAWYIFCILLYNLIIFLFISVLCVFGISYYLILVFFFTSYPWCRAPGAWLSQGELLEGTNEVLSNLI